MARRRGAPRKLIPAGSGNGRKTPAKSRKPTTRKTATPGRPKIDWAEALAYYISLEPAARDYPAVSARFSVSVTSIGKHARAEKWDALAAEIDKQALSIALRTLTHTRADRIRVVRETAYEVATKFLARVREDGYKPDSTDLVQVVKLAELLEGGATERHELDLFVDVAKLSDDELEAENAQLRAADRVIDGKAFKRERPALPLPGAYPGGTDDHVEDFEEAAEAAGVPVQRQAEAKPAEKRGRDPIPGVDFELEAQDVPEQLAPRRPDRSRGR